MYRVSLSLTTVSFIGHAGLYARTESKCLNCALGVQSTQPLPQPLVLPFYTCHFLPLPAQNALVIETLTECFCSRLLHLHHQKLFLLSLSLPFFRFFVRSFLSSFFLPSPSPLSLLKHDCLQSVYCLTRKELKIKFPIKN